MGVFDRFRRSKRLDRASTEGQRSWLDWSGSYKPNWWQLGYRVPGPGMESSAVYACVSIIAQELARLDVKHWRELPGGGREEITTSPAARVLRRPNHYQTRSDFFLSVVSSVLNYGVSFGLVDRDKSNRISAIHPHDARSVSAVIDDQTGIIFYQVSGSQLSGQPGGIYPQNDVMNLRCFTEPGTLRGLSPLAAASYSIEHTQQMQAQQTEFFKGHARPDGILTTDARLTEPQVKRLQQSWKDSFSGSKVGNTAVMEGNLKWQSLTLTADEMSLIESLNWGIDDICRVFRVPLWMVNRTEASTYNNVETMGRVFVMMTLGFWAAHIEQQLDLLFNLPADENIKFAIEAGLMRSEFPQRIEALRTAVQGGIYSPNEARDIEKLPPVDGGDEVFLQQQMVPVDQASEEPKPVPPVLTATPVPDPPDDEPDDAEVEAAAQRLLLAHENGVLRQKVAQLEAGVD